MNTIWHIIINIVIGSIFLLLINQFNYIYLIIISLSGILVDIDHYMAWSLFEKKFNFKDTLIAWHKNIKIDYSDYLFIFHTTEVWLIITIISIIFKFPYIIFGIFIHMICDWIGYKYIHKIKVPFGWSIIYWYAYGKKHRCIVD